MGVEWTINAYLAAFPASLKGVKVTKVSVCDCTRPALIVRDDDTKAQPAFHLVDAYPNAGEQVVISDAVGPLIVRDGISIDVDDTKTVAYIPGRFEIDVTLSVGAALAASDVRNAVQAYYRLIRLVLESVKPALTTYAVQIISKRQTV